MRTVAPAKVNWTLEVLGKRDDGYHEIRSVMQTVDLCDDVSIESSAALSLAVAGEHEASEDDLTLKAARLIAARVGSELPAAIRVTKRIPVGSGLGGGSSDAAATMRLLNELHGLGLSAEDLATAGAEVGSDVPFFVYGGTALVEGRGERVTPLPDASETWMVLVVPPIRVAEKTKRMYQALRLGDFSNGGRSDALSQRVLQGERVSQEDIHNVFERVAYEVFARLDAYREALLSAGARAVHLGGAGPALFALAESEAHAQAMSERIRSLQAKVFVVRTPTTGEATAVAD
jgi:4-diphosphocytidyl-2-C-methyl-D-erythritol kinase